MAETSRIVFSYHIDSWKIIGQKILLQGLSKKTIFQIGGVEEEKKRKQQQQRHVIIIVVVVVVVVVVIVVDVVIIIDVVVVVFVVVFVVVVVVLIVVVVRALIQERQFALDKQVWLELSFDHRKSQKTEWQNQSGLFRHIRRRKALRSGANCTGPSYLPSILPPPRKSPSDRESEPAAPKKIAPNGRTDGRRVKIDESPDDPTDSFWA